MKKFFSLDLLVFFSCIVISIPVVLPYFNQGYFPTHDGEWAVVRLADMYREVRDFQIPPRFSGNLNFGYGYPLFNFAYPMPYYLGLGIHFLHIGYVDSIKTLFAITVPLSAIFMFLLSRKLWRNRWGAAASSVLYVYLPYRMVDLYVRGSIGESVSFVLFPLIFWVALKLQESKSQKLFIFLGALFFASLVLVHNIMAVLFSIIFVFFVFIEKLANRNFKIFPIFIFSMFGLAISMFFWFPALFEKGNILLSAVPIADRNLYYVSFQQFVFPSWGYGVPTDKNAFTYQLGWPQLLGLFLMLFWIVMNGRHFLKNQLGKQALGMLAAVFVLIFFLFPMSSFVWKLPILSEINYPWTMLLPIGFLTALVSGYLATTRLRYLIIILSIFAVILSFPYAKPEYYVDRGDDFYFTNDATTTSSSELMPLWVKSKPFQRLENKVEIIEGKGRIENLVYNSKKISFNADLSADSVLRVNTIYYPGWKAFVDGKEKLINYSNDKGVMEIKVERGNHEGKLQFSETPVRLFADGISLLSLIVLPLLVLKTKKV